MDAHGRVPCGAAAAPALHWGAIAEFWHRDDPANPSSEDDIRRYADDHDRVGEENNED